MIIIQYPRPHYNDYRSSILQAKLNGNRSAAQFCSEQFNIDIEHQLNNIDFLFCTIPPRSHSPHHLSYYLAANQYKTTFNLLPCHPNDYQVEGCKLNGTFEHHHYNQFKPTHQPVNILLIDDVMTSGDTLHLLAEQLHLFYPNAHMHLYPLCYAQ